MTAHLTRDALEAGLPEIRRAPRERGTVALIVRRPAVEEREVLQEGMIDETVGLVGDCWLERGSSSTEDGSANPKAQLTLMNVRVTSLIAVDPERRQLAGDQIYVDFDLSGEHLPAGTQLALGQAVIEITDIPHTGCGKFVKRFGVDAMKWVNSEVGRELNLRGVNTRVVSGGVVRQGDEISVVKRPAGVVPSAR